MAESGLQTGTGEVDRLVTPSLRASSFTSLDPLFADLRRLLTPPKRQSLSQWSESNITLSSEYASRASRLRLYGWQRAIFDAFTDPTIETIVLYCSTQLCKTLFIQCAIAYVVSEDPGPILLVEPTDTDAKDFSRERLQPMIRDCPCLKGRLSDSKMADGSNRLVAKDFPGGNISLVGSQTPGNLARRSIRYLFCDEIDKYPLSVASSGSKIEEGDPLGLARARQVTFGSRKKTIVCCSPTTLGRSRIAKEYARSDQRRPWVKCPFCDHEQTLKWSQVRWDSGVAREKQPLTAKYHCENADCARPWTELQRKQACDRATWRASAEFTGTAGFWISHLYSPWRSLDGLDSGGIVAEFLSCKDNTPELRKFINTVLAEEWEEEQERPPDAKILFDRRESYPFGSPDTAIIPQRGLFLTAAVDVQESPPRLEVEVKAWGRQRENWSIAYLVLQVFADNGQPLPVTSPELWEKLDAEVLSRSYYHESGRYLDITCMAIDTGYRPEVVYDFTRRHPQLYYNVAQGGEGRVHFARTVVPINGVEGSPTGSITGTLTKEDANRKRQHVRILPVNTYRAKVAIYDSLRHRLPRADGTLSGAPSPGCSHFPLYTLEYFEGLTAESLRQTKTGKLKWQQDRKRNEQIDLAVYGLAMAVTVGIDRFTEEHWARMEADLTPPEPDTADPTADSDPDSDMVVSESHSLSLSPSKEGVAEASPDIPAGPPTSRVSDSAAPSAASPTSQPPVGPTPVSRPTPARGVRGIRGIRSRW